MPSSVNTQTQSLSGPLNYNYPDGTTLDNCVIGATTPKAGTFTTLTSTSRTPLAPVAVGASLTLTAASFGKTVLLNTAAGSVATLPAATGSGGTFTFVVSVSTTSNAHKILAASSSDFIIGVAMGYTGSTAKVFGSAAATNHSIQMPFSGSQPSGGIIGDYFEFTDIGANLWEVRSMYQGGTTPTTPFSSATT